MPEAVCATPKACRYEHGFVAVAVNVAAVTPLPVAVTETAPMGPSESSAAVSPFASVVLDAGDTVPPPAVTDHETVAPASAVPVALFTTTRSDSGRSSPPGPLCPLPLTTLIEPLGPVESAPHPVRSVAPTTARAANEARRTASSGGCSPDVLTCTPGEGPATSS